MMWLKNVFRGISLIVFSAIITNAQAKPWDLTEPFLPNSEEPRVEFGEFHEAKQIIAMDENITDPVIIAYLNYDGDIEPTLLFNVPNYPGNEQLGAVIGKPDKTNNWELIITKQQDFEAMSPPQVYAFNVRVENEEITVMLRINNIDNKEPVISLTNPCSFEENKVGLSSCVYNINDRDGIMKNFVKYTITDAEGNVSDLFSIKNLDEIKNGMKDWQVSLEIMQCLDFELVSVYLLDLTVTDSGNNNGTAKIIVEVIDMPDEPPRWKKIFASIQLDEKTTERYQVEAIDGDIGINDPVNYYLETTNPDEKQYFEIDKTTGWITVNKIDRDALQQQMFSFKVVAYEVPDPKWHINQSVTVIVNDVNDNVPKVTVTPKNHSISIPENSATKLSFEIDIEDPDLGENGTYTVTLIDEKSDQGYHKAFQIIPDQGYQNATFTIAVIDSSLLDYEVPEWQNIKFEIYCEEVSDESHFDRVSIQVDLENLNDELPLFDKAEYVVEYEETIPEGTYLGTVHATDRDIDDNVTHTLLGTRVNSMFRIEPYSGDIYTLIDNAIDYERENETIIQVQAMDELHEIYHRNITDFKIKVIDVNDEKPTLIIPPVGVLNITENSEHKTIVNTNFPILAIDEDTEADVKFHIDWEKSYARKRGKPVDKEEYIWCIGVDTIQNGDGRNVSAILWVNETRKNNTPDYEKFDNLFISLVALDTNQTILPNSDEAILPIEIGDLNDNAPVFVESTLKSRKVVVEHTKVGTYISTVYATDEDDPPHNEIIYKIVPSDPTIPEDWITIDENEGHIYVNSPDIDADGDDKVGRPPYWNLTYIVRAENFELENQTDILINVTDINDNKPILEPFDKTVKIFEASPNDTDVQTIVANDRDRDEVFNTPWFRFTDVTQETEDFFSIDFRSGKVFVNYKTGKVLDRDFGTREFTISILYGDNFAQFGGTQFVDHISFTVILKDINNQNPLITQEDVNTWEKSKKGDVIGEVKAKDYDEEGTINTEVEFTIISIKNSKLEETVPKDLFAISTDDDFASQIGKLTTNYDLETLHGVYIVHVMTEDHGEFPDGSLSDDKDITVNVQPYNFKKPTITYPRDEEILYLDKKQNVEAILRTIDGKPLEDFTAEDNQGGKWDLKFTIANKGNDDDFPFIIRRSVKSEAQLMLSRQPVKTDYKIELTVNCECVGDDPKTHSIIISVRFQDSTAEPRFQKLEQKVDFFENETGVGSFAELEKACWIEDDCDRFKPYYFFLGHTEENCKFGEFHLGRTEKDNNRPLLTVVEMLDRETVPNYTLTIVASQNPNGNSIPNKESMLTVHVTVLDVNDNPPNFKEKYYSGVVKQTDPVGMKILNVTATDLDLNDSMKFYIKEGSIKPEGSGIPNLDDPFKVQQFENNYCNILLNFPIQSIMSGHITFDLIVEDEAQHTDTAEVRVYIVSGDSRNTFTFTNSLEEVEPKQEEIRSILQEEYEYDCNIENIQQATKKDADAGEKKVDVLAHFIRPNDSKPVDKEEITRKSSDPAVFGRLEQNFKREGLTLDTFNIEQKVVNMEKLFRNLLISVSVVLTTLIVFLVILFVCKVRSLSQRLSNLSETKFGSQESGLNRMGIAAPNTNKHAVQGSNPVYSEEKRMPDLDTMSVDSGDSDLIGIEDNPNFAYDNDFGASNHHTTKSSNS